MTQNVASQQQLLRLKASGACTYGAVKFPHCSLLLVCALQQSAGFPEVDTDTFLDWNSSFTTSDNSTHLRSTGVYATSTQATHAAGSQLQHADSLTPLSTHTHLQQPSTASSALSVSAAARSSSINGVVSQGANSVSNPQAADSAGESVSMSPMGLQIPKLAPLDVPPDMPSGVSIATARVSAELPF